MHLAGSIHISYVLELLELTAGVLFFDPLRVLWTEDATLTRLSVFEPKGVES